MLRRAVTGSSTPSVRLYATKAPRQSFLSPYISRLRSSYPNADPASLVASFLILHEISAIVPLFAGFWSFKALGLGAAIIAWAAPTNSDGQREEVVPSEQNDSELMKETKMTWARAKVNEWVAEGEVQAEKIGRRYGVLGYKKESKEERLARKSSASEPGTQVEENFVADYRISGDVANLVASYLAVKALMPLRIVFSLRFAPPLANLIVNRFKSLRNFGGHYLNKAAKSSTNKT